MTIGERIKTARKKAKLTQRALGEKCDMPDSQIRQYELGMVTPKIETLRRIAKGLDVPLYELADWGQYTTEDFKEDLASGTTELTRPIAEMNNQPLDRTPETHQEANKQRENILLEQYRKLNTEGQVKAVEAVENLTYNPKYAK